MTITEFLEELKQIDGFKIIGPQIRRLTKYDGDLDVEYYECPICAVANKKAGKFEYINSGYVKASIFLGLNQSLAHEIVDIADGGCNDNQDLTEKLLEACKIN